MMPPKITIGASSRRGAARTIIRSSAAIRPVRSATAMPISVASTVPSGGNATKFGTTLAIIRCRPSSESRFTMAMVWPLAGWTAETPCALSQPESSTMSTARPAKSVEGFGRRLPTRSTRLRNRWNSVARAGASGMAPLRQNPPRAVNAH